MELGVNDGRSSDGLSGQSIDPAKVRKQWQAAVRHVGGISCAGRCAKKCRFPAESWLCISELTRQALQGPERAWRYEAQEGGRGGGGN
jgi:hypothetical protein